MIEVDGLTRRFDDVTAVEGLTLRVAQGEVFGFLGPNGAGKTTTVRMLTALIAPTAGRASVAGFDVVEEAQQVRAATGILTETPGLYSKLDATDNLRLFAELYGVDEVEPRIERFLKLLDLWDRRDSPVGSFSKGMRQKLAIARALLHEPSVVFLDEPTSALDPASARVVRDFIAELKGEGRTIFLCTHNLDEAERLCDRVALFRRRLVRVDTPANLRRGLYGRAVEVRLREATGAHVAALEALAAVESVEAEGTHLRVGVEEPELDTPHVVRALVGAGADVVAVHELEQSLEQVYLDLLGDTDEQEAT